VCIGLRETFRRQGLKEKLSHSNINARAPKGILTGGFKDSQEVPEEEHKEEEEDEGLSAQRSWVLKRETRGERERRGGGGGGGG
jgi:hypothetical protein